MRFFPGKKPAVFVLLLILLGFLCALPAVSHAAQSSGSLPEPDGSYTLPSGTLVSDLPVIFGLRSNRKLTVFDAGGTARENGTVHTGDLVVIRDSSGRLLDCIAIVVQGEASAPSSGSGQASEPPPSLSSGGGSAVSSEAPSSGTSCSSAVSSEAGESSAPDSPASSSAPASSAAPVVRGGAVFESSVPVTSLAGIFGGEAAGVTVFAPDGTERTNGMVCTGDAVVLQGETGNTLRTVTVTVLGDLTRCGVVTQSGCRLLHSYLSGRSALPPDLLMAADMNRDGLVDTADLLEMKLRLRQSASSGGVSPSSMQ